VRVPDFISRNLDRAIEQVMGGAEGGPGARFRQGVLDGWGKLRRRLRATWAALGWLDDGYDDEDERRRRARQLLGQTGPSMPSSTLEPAPGESVYKAEVDAGRLAARTQSKGQGAPASHLIGR